MSHSPLVRARRTAGLATACGALLIAGLSAPASGQVADDDGYFETDIDSGSYASGPGSCAVLSNPGGTSFELSAGETVTDSSDESLAVEYSDDASDTQSLRVRGTSTASWTTSGGGLRAAGLTSEATISGSAALGDDTACRTYLEYENYLDIETSVPSDGFIELSLHTSGDGRGEIGFYQRSTGAGAALNSGSGGIVKRGTVASSRTFVEAGELGVFGYSAYEGNLPEFDGSVIVTRSGGTARAADDLAAGASVAEAVFVAAGSATTKPTGSGKKYVDVGSRSCGNDKVTTKLKNKAGKASKVTYYVDGKKVKTLGKPKSGKTVKLALEAASDSTVKVVVKSKKGKNVSVTRSYVACTG